VIAKLQLYDPTSDQLMIHQDDARFRIIAAGRRWGKNWLAQNDMASKAWTYPQSMVWWCSPVYRQAKRDYRRFKKFFKPVIEKFWDSELRIELKNETYIEFHGLEEPENIEGEGLDFLYVDESGLVKDNAIYNSLLPMLMDKQGKAVFFGKPKGKGNWFYKFFSLGLGSDDLYNSYQYTIFDNPYIEAEDVKRIQQITPDRIFKQEYMAEFVDDGSGVFAGYNACIDDSIVLGGKPIAGHYYRIGIDIAKHQDFTVLTVIDMKSNSVVDFKRFNELDYNIQKSIIYNFAKHWGNAELIIDSTGVGEPIYDDLSRSGLIITSFKFSNTSKIKLIENLIITIQNRGITFPIIPDLITELDLFEYNRTPSGNVRYSAPEGFHDDCVISLALAVWDLSNQYQGEKLITSEVQGNYGNLF
jgi:hypothetical protein